MGQGVLRCNPSIDVLVRKSAQARRLSLRVSRLDGRVTLTLPKGVSEREGRRFVESRADWIENARREATTPLLMALGTRLPVEDRVLTIAPGAGRVPQIDGDYLRVPGDDFVPALRKWLVQRAREKANAQATVYAAELGRSVNKLTLRDTRSRWGSCTQAGNIMLSWRLILAPGEVFDYVIAHEVAHLSEMNHSPAFWKTVEGLMPGFDRPRRWLRTEGHRLHAYRFD